MSIMSRWQRLERDFFRALNSVVEPAVRRGVASPRYTPGSLIVLESTGFKSGQQRRTPLAALRLGRYILVGTARGNRSFWPRNLANEPEVTYYQGGRAYSSTAHLIHDGGDESAFSGLPRYMQKLYRLLEPYTRRGWVFALLVRN
ncbi:MAG: nitroreductase family deazaflavin-dependent oxidoreductase [Haliea sp.]|jgi:deazaflavin-dependent oxidoreductase (nitroreductase family)|nr:nitroreductase family deazaflavin-dependent oxidoreductase [Haliea sp.]